MDRNSRLHRGHLVLKDPCLVLSVYDIVEITFCPEPTFVLLGAVDPAWAYNLNGAPKKPHTHEHPTLKF